MAIQLAQLGDSLVNLTSSPVFSNARAAQSISVWVNSNWGTIGTPVQSLVGMYAAGGGTAIQIGSRSAANCTVWTWGGGVLAAATGFTMLPDQWYHIAYTYDTTTHRVYINGVLRGSSTATQLAGNFNQVFINGYLGGGSNETAAFHVDTYNYYTRTLTPDEIMTIYNTQGNRHGIIHGSLLRYEFDEGVVGEAIASIKNQSDYDRSLSDLVAYTPAGASRILFSPAYVANNLRPPLI